MLCFPPPPAFQMNCLQALQNACVGFVTRRFAGVEDVVKLSWLLVNKNVELNILKLAHKSLYDPALSIPRESGTFQHSAATIFNKLPVAIRNLTEYNSFCCSVKRHLLLLFIYLSGFDKRYLQKFFASVSFEACSVFDLSFFLFFF